MDLPETGMRSELPQRAALSGLKAPQTGSAMNRADMEQLMAIIQNQEIANKNMAVQLQILQANAELAQISTARRHEELVSSTTSTKIHFLCKQHQPRGGDGFTNLEDFFTEFRQVFAGVHGQSNPFGRYYCDIQREMARHVSKATTHNPQHYIDLQQKLAKAQVDYAAGRTLVEPDPEELLGWLQDEVCGRYGCH